MMTFEIPDKLLKLATTVHDAGGRALLVGGCVRDMLMGVISLSDIAEREPAKRAARTLRAVSAREAPRTSH